MRELFFLILAIGAAYWFYTDWQASGSLTGKAYYEACWERVHKTRGFDEPIPSTPYQAGQWKQCEPVAKRAMFENGLIFAGLAKDEKDEDGQRLGRACPNVMSEVPLGGIFFLYVKDTEAEGGVSGIDAFLPASWTIFHWSKKRWPNCSAERGRQGYPKIVEQKDGIFGWERPCSKCK